MQKILAMGESKHCKTSDNHNSSDEDSCVRHMPCQLALLNVMLLIILLHAQHTYVIYLHNLYSGR